MTSPQQTQILQDFKRLRWNLALLVLCAIAGAAVVMVSLNFTSKAQQVEHRARADQDAIRVRLSRARDEEQELRDKLARYRQIEEHGLIGQEHRLDWVEQIRKIKQARKLIDVQYELLPQQPVSAGLLPGGGTAEFMASTMNLHMQLLHEEDLLNFLADLRSEVSAYVRVDSCKVERVSPDTFGATAAAQLRADCVLDWITLRERKVAP